MENFNMVAANIFIILLALFFIVCFIVVIPHKVVMFKSVVHAVLDSNKVFFKQLPLVVKILWIVFWIFLVVYNLLYAGTYLFSIPIHFFLAVISVITVTLLLTLTELIIFGVILASVTYSTKALVDIPDSDIGNKLLLSYSMILLFCSFLISNTQLCTWSEVCIFIALLAGYALNMIVLAKVAINPKRLIKSETDISAKDGGIFAFSVFMIISLIIMNLFVLALFSYRIDGSKAYDNVSSLLDLLYYTVISFTTIGYGDIHPISALSKFVSVLISISSVACITILLSSALAIKDIFFRSSNNVKNAEEGSDIAQKSQKEESHFETL